MEKQNFLNIYLLENKEKSFYDIKSSSAKRNWMNENDGWAYNCLPLKIANQYGWTANSPCDIEIDWKGSDSPTSFKITCEDDKFNDYVDFNFGTGIFTFISDFIIKTNPGTSLYIRGISNSQKDLIFPLDGIVETDWLPFTFSFSFKFLKPGTVKFNKDEPIFMFFPIERDYIENFNISYKFIGDNLDLKDKRNKFNESRNKHNANMIDGKLKPQKFYIKGIVVDEEIKIKDHKVSLKLKEPVR